MNHILNPQKIAEIFKVCCQTSPDEKGEFTVVDGITLRVSFNKARLEEHKEMISQMLTELPIEFQESSKSGGMSFLNACYDKNGQQWTGAHRTMEQLFLLGIGIQKVVCVFPRQIWKVLPGGVPYYMVLDGKYYQSE